MPAMLTHDFFGQDAYGPALEAIGLYTPDERDAFLLGNQGPDPLFYLMLVPPLKEFEVLGNTMYHEAPSSLLLSMRRAVDALEEADQPVGRAYLAGFVCHYLLDRAMHPLVYYWERGLCQAGVEGLDPSDGGIVHAEIERDLDEMVLYAKRNQTIDVYRPYEQVLRGREEMLDVVGKVYFGSVVGPLAEGEPSTTRIFPLAVSCFRIAQRMFWAPKMRKADMLARVEKPALHHRYSLVRTMSHRVRAEATSNFDNREHRTWRNPFTGETCTTSFWDIYEGTLREVTSAIATVLGDGFDDEAARTLTRGLNFSGERVE